MLNNLFGESDSNESHGNDSTKGKKNNKVLFNI